MGEGRTGCLSVRIISPSRMNSVIISLLILPFIFLTAQGIRQSALYAAAAARTSAAAATRSREPLNAGGGGCMIGDLTALSTGETAGSGRSASKTAEDKAAEDKKQRAATRLRTE